MASQTFNFGSGNRYVSFRLVVEESSISGGTKYITATLQGKKSSSSTSSTEAAATVTITIDGSPSTTTYGSYGLKLPTDNTWRTYHTHVISTSKTNVNVSASVDFRSVSADGSLSSQTFYGTPTTYTVTLNKLDGTTTKVTANTNSTYTPSTDASVTGSKTGYTFTGWSPASKKITENTTFTAQSRQDEYKIKLNPNGGISKYNNSSAIYELSTRLKYNGTNLNNLSGHTPTRSGYKFLGWWLGDIQTHKADGSYMPNTSGVINGVTQTCWNKDGVWKADGYDGGLWTFTAKWEIQNICYIKDDNQWKLATVYVKDNNTWKPAIMYTKVNNEWKQSGP